ncbi:MAG: hypothetical protein DMF61_18180 [Blastocatellia bacterium AA13]|nr:MAG: hypothetical protein DMF61_18180 [Blastocatellia bacterium AA13]
MQHERMTWLKPKLRGVALGLVLLIAHAAAVTVTHHHTLLHSSNDPTALAISNSDGAAQSPLSGSDSQCLSCGLQRNIISEIGPASFVVAIVPCSYQCRDTEVINASKTALLLLSNRAPPVS